MIKCYIYSILLYAVEVWTANIKLMRKLAAFAMWLLRRLLKVPNEINKYEMKIKYKLNGAQNDKKQRTLVTIKRRKTAYLRQILRNNKYELMRMRR